MNLNAKLRITFALVTLGLSVISVQSHTMGMGACPRIQPMKPFDMAKFKGSWYVIQKFSTSSTCLKYNFADGADGKMRLIQSSQHYALDAVGVDDFTYTGVLTIPDSADPARMKVKFPLNVAGEADYFIYKTDYDTYGVVYSCQKILVGHTKSMSILARTPTLDQAILDQIRSQIRDDGMDPSDFSKIDHSNCANNDGNFKVKIDDKTFTSGSMANVAKKVGETVGSSIDRAAGLVVSRGDKTTGDPMTEATSA